MELTGALVDIFKDGMAITNPSFLLFNLKG